MHAHLAERLRRIRWSTSDWANAAGVSLWTAHRYLSGTHDTRLSSARALEDALVAEEQALRDWLVSAPPGAMPDRTAAE